jgi:hypothetical protein
MKPFTARGLSGVIAPTAILLACGLAADGQPKTVPALPDDVIAAWKKAGGQVGTMWLDRDANLLMGVGLGANDFGLPIRGDEIPAFTFSRWKSGVIEKLPRPRMPFGLTLHGFADTDYKELAGFKDLQMLALRGSDLTGVGLKELAGLKGLRSLSLLETELTDVGLKDVAELKGLITLDLRHTRVTDAGLKELAGLRMLQALSLPGTRVTEAGWKELAALEELRAVDLRYMKVTADGLKQLAALKNLQTLRLVATGIGDVDLKEVAKMKGLRALDIRGTWVTDAGVAELQKALPNLRIDRRKLARLRPTDLPEDD